MTLLFSLLTLVCLLAVTLFAQATGFAVGSLFGLIAAFTFYVVWQARKQQSLAVSVAQE